MNINLEYKGLKGIEDFINSTLEIYIPPEPEKPYKYIHSIEYQLIKKLTYRVVLYGRELINSNQHMPITGITLQMYDEIENRKLIHFYQESFYPSIIWFNPYEIYKGCLDSIIKPENSFHPEIRTHLNNMEIYFTCELYNFSNENVLYLQNYEYIHKAISNSSYIINELNSYNIKWQITNLNDDTIDENPNKKHKN